jgi:hypothetical protein
MGRKANLIYEYSAVLKTIRKGSHASKKRYFNVMKSIVSDLLYIHQAPYSFRQLNLEQVQRLVEFWRKQQKKPAAIMNLLSVLRKYCKLANPELVLPTNKSLELSRNTIDKTDIAINPRIIEKVHHPITRSIIALQLYFGLTKLESIKLIINAADLKQLVVYRDAANNNRDRIVPIVTAEQKQAIAERVQLLGCKNRLIDITPFKIICDLYNAELAVVKIKPAAAAFRKYYALNRFNALINKISKEAIYHKLQIELGFASIYTLRRWFNE